PSGGTPRAAEGGRQGRREGGEEDRNAYFLFRLQHQKMHAKYHGHKSMHREIVLVLVATLVLAQILLVPWKQRHCQSYSAISLSERQLFCSCIALWHQFFLSLEA
uniref:Uncharacterized protein n=1 Tax=Anser brachyrhynchus TaxID=132585 RepID=A0A8B9CA84_9AVES